MREPVIPLVAEKTCKLTVPVKPLRGVTVIVEVPDPPGMMNTVAGFAEIVKSGGPGTMTISVVEWTKEPLVPVTVIV